MQTFVFFIGELKCQKKVWCSINCIVGYLKEALRNVALFPSHCLDHKKKMFTSHRLHVITYISFRQSQKEKKIELSPEFVVSQSMKIICVNNW